MAGAGGMGPVSEALAAAPVNSFTAGILSQYAGESSCINSAKLTGLSTDTTNCYSGAGNRQVALVSYTDKGAWGGYITITDPNTVRLGAAGADKLKITSTGLSVLDTLDMGSKKITALAEGMAATDAVNKGQLDAAFKYIKVNNNVTDAEASATGTRDIALGANAVADTTDAPGRGSSDYGVALGSSSQAYGSGSMALGSGALAGTVALKKTVMRATAVGSGATVTAANATALGSGAVADRANTVSVGRAEVKDAKGTVTTTALFRQIANLADGTDDHDAVNLSQLKALGLATDTDGKVTNAFVAYDGTSKTKVTLGGTGATTAVTLSNVAAGVSSTDAVNKGQLDTALKYIAVSPAGAGAGATATSENAIAIGSGANANNYIVGIPSGGIAIGTKAVANYGKNIALGDGAAAKGGAYEGGYNIAIGAGASAEQTTSGYGHNTALGANSFSKAYQGTALGAGATTTALYSTALGAGSVADRANTVSVGRAEVKDDKGKVTTTALFRQIANLADGTEAHDAVNKSQLDAVRSAVTEAKAAADTANKYVVVNSTGAGATASGTDAIAIGQSATANGDNSNAFGNLSVASSMGSNAFGNAANATGASATALGHLATASGNNSNAVGAVSFAGGTGANAFGNAASATGAKASALGHLATAGGNSSVALGDSSTATGLESLALGHGATASGKYSLAVGSSAVADRDDVVSFGSSAYQRKLINVAAGTADTDAVNLGQLRALGLTVDTSGKATNAFVAYDGTSKDKVTLGGVGATTVVTLSNVAAGTSSTDAVNKGQLDAAFKYIKVNYGVTDAEASATGTRDIALGANAVADTTDAPGRGSSDYGVALGSSSQAYGRGSMALGSGALAGTVALKKTAMRATAVGSGATVTAANATALGSGAVADRANTVSVGRAEVKDDKGKVTTTAVFRQIANLADGTDDHDAVNLSQLKALGLATDTDGKVTNAFVAYDSTSKTKVTLGGTGATKAVMLSNVADGVSTSDAVNVGQLKALGLTMGSDGKVTNAFVAYDDTSKTKVTLGGTGATTAVTLSNVAAGVSGTDAVNVSQLKDLGLTTDTSGKITNAFVSYDGTSKDKVTLGGKDGTTITNVKAGTLSSSSTDAVNGSQLFATNTNVTKAQAAADAAGTALTALSDVAVKYNDTSKTKVTLGGTGATTAVKLSNVAAGVSGTDAVNVSQLKDLGLTTDTSGKITNAFVSYDGTSKDTVTLGGKDGTTITNVKAGTLSSSSTDAVNGSQLFTVSDIATKAKAAADTANKYVVLGTTTGPGAKAEGANAIAIGSGANAALATGGGDGGIAIGTNAVANYGKNLALGDGAAAKGGAYGTGYNTAIGAEAFAEKGTGYDWGFNTAIGGKAYVKAGSGTALGASATVTANGSTALGADTIANRADTVSVGRAEVKDATGKVTTKALFRQIVNMADGKEDHDAVNLGQLKALGLTTDTSGKATNAFVSYDGTSKDKVTLGGKDGTTITNVKAGTLSSSSTDAVNGSQLFATNTNVTKAQATADAAGTALTALSDVAVKYDDTSKTKVTLGGTGATTAVTLSNVAAGVSGTDAVNVSQLKDLGLTTDTSGKITNAFVSYDGTSKDKVTLGGKDGTTITNVKAGTLSSSSMDAVNGSQLFTVSDIATKAKAAADTANKYVVVNSTGAGATASSTNAIAIGSGAISNGPGSDGGGIAIGTNAVSTYGKNLALGDAASAKGGAYSGGYNTSIGAEAFTETLSGGSGYNTALGGKATVSADFGTALGAEAKVIGNNSNAVGRLSFAGATGANAFGNNATVSGLEGIAFGHGAKSSGKYSVAVGSSAVADRDSAVSFGSSSFKRQLINVAAGTADTDAVNLGQLKAYGLTTDTSGKATNAFVAYDSTSKDKVTLGGAGATTAVKLSNVAAGVSGTDAVNVSQLKDLGLTTDTSGKITNAFVSYDSTSKDKVTLGGKDGTTITNVKAGTLSSSSTDAVNGSQLFATNTNVTKAQATADAAGTALTSLSDVAVKYDDTSKTKVTLGGTGATTAVKLSNVAAGVSGTDAVNVSQLKDLGLTTDTSGKITNAFVSYDGTSKDTVTLGGKDGTTITNVKAGTLSSSSTDAVNGSQLFATNTNVTKAQAAADAAALATTTLSGVTVKYDDTSKTKVTLGGTGATTAVKLSNVAAGVSGTDAVNVSQLKDLGLTTDTSGKITNAFVSYDGTSKDTVTLGGKDGTTITNVKAGTLSSSSTDAVNGSQLFATNTNVTKAQAAADAAALATTTLSGVTVKYDDTSKTKVTLGGTGATTAVKLSNVAAGVSGTDAVNVSQLKDLGLTTDTSGKITNAFVSYDGTSKDTVTLGGKDGTTITNVKAGTLSSSSTDAVNGSQLFATNTNVTKAQAAADAAALATTTLSGVTVKYDDTSKTKVTLGGTGATTAVKLSNVAAGVSGTDAVNVSQLKDLGLTTDTSGKITNAFVSYDGTSKDTVTLGGKDGTTITNVKAGTLSSSSTDAVNGSQLFTVSDIATKAKAAADTANKYVVVNSTGAGATAPGSNAIALGDSTTASGLESLALGHNAKSSGKYSVAVGSSSVADRDDAVSFGSSSYQRKLINVAAGTADTDAVNLGQLRALGLTVDTSGKATNAFVAYDGASKDKVTLGGVGATTVVTLSNVAAGTSSTDAVNKGQLDAAFKYIKVNNSVADAGASATGTRDIALGANAVADAADAPGHGLSDYGIAIGSSSQAYGSGSMALGSGALAGTVALKKTAMRATAVGSGATVTAANATALGSGAVADRANTVSVGRAEVKDDKGKVTTTAVFRQIANLADGTDDHDAVNLSQLKALGLATDTDGKVTNAFVAYDSTSKTKVTLGGTGATKAVMLSNVADGVSTSDAVNVGQLKALGLTMGSDGKVTNAFVAYDDTSKTKVTLGGTGATTAVKLSNVAAGVSGTDAVNVSQLKDLGLTTDTSGKITNAFVSYDGTSKDTVTLGGKDGTTITNVKAGTLSSSSTDAVNGSQLFATNTNVTKAQAAADAAALATTTLSGVTVKYDDTSKTKVTLGGTGATTAVKLSNVAAGVSGTDAVNVSQLKDLGLTTDTSGKITNAFVSYDGTSKDKVTLGGKDGTTITNVKAGTLSSSSTDAVNGSQLFATNTNVTKAQAAADAAGTALTALSDVAVKYDDTSKTKVTLGGTGATKAVMLSNVADGVSTSDAVNVGQLKALGLTMGSDGKATNAFVAYDSTSKDKVTLGGTGATKAVMLSNVADGVSTSDAVNVGQLKALGLTMGSDGKVTNAFVAYDDTSKTKVTLGGTGATTAVKLSNVAAGVSGTDAVNVSQLKDLGLTTDTSGKITNAFVSYDGTSKDTVTLGGKDGTTITNVKAGTLSSSSTDAVNGSQLFATNTNVTKAQAAADAAALATTTLSGVTVKYDDTSKTKVTLGGTGATTAVKLSNVAAGVSGTDAVNVSQLKDLGLTTDTSGKITNAFVSYDGTSKDTVTLGGKDGTTITNVKAGTLSSSSTDAVNGSQLFATNTNVTKAQAAADAAALATTTLSGVTVKYDDTSKTKVTLGGTGATTAVKLSNVAAGVSGTDAVNVSQLKDLGLTTDTSGKITNAFVSYDGTSKDKVTLGGKDGTTITNVKAGTLSSSSTDAVNGSQLFATNTNVTKAQAAADAAGTALTALSDVAVKYDDTSKTKVTLGGTGATKAVMLSNVADGVSTSDAVNVGQLKALGLTMGSDGKATNAFVAYDSTSKDKVTLGGTGATKAVMLSNVADGVSTSDAVNVGQLKALGLTMGSDGKVTNAFVAYDDTSKTKVTLGGTGATTAVKLSNVAAGVSGTDAVNVSQLKDLGLTTDTSGKITNAFVSYDGTSKDTVTLGGKDGTTITNVKAGTLSSSSTDAVNGSQLFATNTNVTKAQAAADAAALATTTLSGVTVKYDDTSKTKVTLGGTGATTAVKLSNVAAGVSGTDAVNVSQLKDLGLTTDTSGKITNAFVSYDGTSKDKVTLGGKDGTTITNVKAGTLSSSSTDAVNGSQLFATNTNVTKAQAAADAAGTALTALSDVAVKYDDTSKTKVTLGGTGATKAVMLSNVADGVSTSDAVNVGQLKALGLTMGSDGKATNAFVAYDSTSKDKVTLGGTGATKAVMLSNVADGVSTSDAVNVGQLKALGLTMGSDGKATNAFVAYDSTSKDKVTLGGTGATKAVMLSNVADGVSTSDAVNVGQLKALGLTMGSDGKVTNAFVAYDDTSKTKVTLGGTGATTAVKLSNVAAGVSGTDAVNVSQLKDLGLTTDTSGKITNAFVSYDGTSKDTVTLGGKDGTTITNVKAGTLSSSSTDAVNGSQLFATNTNVTKAQATADAAGTALTALSDVAVKYDDTSKTKVTLGGTGATKAVMLSNVADGVSTSDAVNVGQLKALGLTMGSDGKVTNAFVAYDDTSKTKVTLGGTGATTAVKLSNVAAGVSGTDAVNVSQLKDLGLTTDTSGKITNAFVSYDGTSKDKVTLGGKDGTTITNVKAGTLSSSSTDAVNGSQLFATNTNVTKAQATADAAGTALTALSDVAVKYDDTSKTKVTLGGTGATKAVMLSNVADGVSTSDAVNVGQLKALGLTMGSDGKVTNAFVAYDDTSKTKVTLGGTGATTAVKLSNVAAGVSGTDAVNVSQLKDLGLTTDTSGKITNAFVSYDGTSKDTVTLGGKDGTTITNVKAGTLSSSSTDAVNGSQLFATNTNVTKAQATADAAGTALTALSDVAVKYDDTSKTKVTLGGTGATKAVMLSNVADGVSTSDAVNVGQLKALGLTMGSDGKVTNAFVAYDDTSKTKVTLGGTGATTAVKLSNVAAGVSGTDAVNVSQLKDLGLTTDTSGKITNAFVSYDGTSKDTVTLGGKDGTTITNVKAGTLSSSSTDAVNGSQLFATNTNVTKAQATADAAGKALTALSDVAVKYNDTSKTKVTLGGSASASAVMLSNVAAGVSGTDAVNVSQLKDLGLTTDTSGKITNAFVAYDSTSKDTVTLGGKDGTTITNVKAGTLASSSTDAVNGSQLFATNENVKQNTTDIARHAGDISKAQATADAANTALTALSDVAVKYDDTSKTKVTLGGSARAGAVTLSNVAAGVADTDAVNVEQLKDLGLTTGSDGKATNAFVSYDSMTKNTVTLSGKDGTTITNVKAGELSASSMDAVNGAQLHNVASSTASALGGGSTVNADGTVSMPVYTVDGAKVNGVGAAISKLDERASNNSTQITQITNDIKTGALGLVTQDSKSGNILVASAVGGGMVNMAGTDGPRVISGVANGTANSDAVTVAQLKAVGLIDPSGKAMGAVVYDDLSLKRATLGGAGGTVLDHVADGRIASGSLEAVNGGQLNTLKEDFQSKYDTLNGKVVDLNTRVENSASGGGGSGGTGGNKADNGGMIAPGTGTNSVVIGPNSQAPGASSMAMGPNATANGNNSIAIGQDSVADRDNTVSVGSENHERQITNVAGGTAPTDAVNVQQLRGVQGQVNDVARRAYTGVAMAMAMSGTYLPQLAPGEKTLGVGVGGYKGYGALAVNFKALTTSGRLSWGAGVSSSGHDVGFNAGAGWKW
ncbi:YadA-like family protein [Paraburkholderia bonniea]|uniref:YadA-like family protein n=1 Tax=Paraburkholderia bonniea TaxID=2152891 RepID=UPI001FE780F1|nr:YadA-like family protein [Paraburkholderia bonniea]